MADINSLKDWHFTVDEEAIAWAVLDREGERVNTLGRRPIEELGTIVLHVEDLARKLVAKGLVFISAKESSFVHGADIRDVEALRRLSG